MNNSLSSNTGLRLVAALAVGIIMGYVMGQGVDYITTEVSTLASVLAAVFGFAATYLLKEGSPRREQPSNLGTIGLLIMLACYLVIGRLVILQTDGMCIFLYALVGALLIWLTFTATAETPLLSAFGIGGFCSGFMGVIITFMLPEQFNALLSLVNFPDERAMIYTNIGLICALPGAFAALAGRLSGWGLVQNTKEEIWAFTAEGRLYTKKEIR